MNQQGNIRTFQSRATDTRLAVQEFHAGVVQPEMALVLFFCSSHFDLELLATEMRCLFVGVRVVGCTTSGEIGPSGYCEHSLTGASFPAGSFAAVSGLLPHLQAFNISAGKGFAQLLLQELESHAPGANVSNSFGLMLVDGLSIREESVAHAFQRGLGEIPVFGGSAGDDLAFKRTRVYVDGEFHADSAALVLVSTALPFHIFKTQHFVASGVRLVVTEADVSRRIVNEINGLPAAAEYARLVGVDSNDLNPMRFAASPVVVKIGGTDYVRSIQKANADGSLTFYCAIEAGLVLRLAQGVDMLKTLEQTFADIRQCVGEPQLVLGCDCILRNLELAQTGQKEHVGEIFKLNHMLGFNSYGEQYLGVHVNQTLTGVAIGTGVRDV
ncbi:MAG: nitric oxide-sensing protein NosP [Gallionellaceae bacterium]|jgi:hypothetical protein